jgi:ATP-binding cassette subfamily B protein
MKISFKQHRRLLAGYLRPQWPRVLLLAALILSHIGLQLVNPQIVRTFIDTAQAGGALGKLTGAALLFLGVVVVAPTTGAAWRGGRGGWTFPARWPC